jgi:hypothetical protein
LRSELLGFARGQNRIDIVVEQGRDVFWIEMQPRAVLRSTTQAAQHFTKYRFRAHLRHLPFVT